MRKYRKDYKAGEEGYQYLGEWYRCQAAAETIQSQVKSSMGCLIAAAFLFVAALSFENQAGRVSWVLLPFVSMVFPMAYGLMGSLSLWILLKKQKQGRLLRNDGGKNQGMQVIVPKGHEGELVRVEYEKGVRRPWRSSIALSLLSIFAFAGDVVLLFTGGGFKQSRELLFAFLCILIVLCSILYMEKTYKIKKEFYAVSPIK